MNVIFNYNVTSECWKVNVIRHDFIQNVNVKAKNYCII